jgi:hypothetical protein
MRMLECGAGTGLVTQALRDSVGPVTMVDTSAAMREVMQNKIAAETITDARIWDIDLATESAPNEDFDLIVTVMTLHHIPIVETVRRASPTCWSRAATCASSTSRKRTGPSTAPTSTDTMGSTGPTELASSLDHVGFTDVTFQPCHQIVRDGASYPVFLAACVRHLDNHNS